MGFFATFSKENIRHSLYFLRRMMAYFRPYRLRIVFSVLAMGVVALCTAYSAFLVKPALDEIFINKDTQALKTIPLLVILVFALKGVFRVLQTYHMQYCGLKVLERLRNELYSKILRLPMTFFEQSQVGMLMSRIVNDVNLIRNSIPEIVMLFRHVLTMLALIFVAFYRDPYLSCWALIVLPLALGPVVYFGRKLRKLARRNQEKIADISTILQEIFSSIKVVKAFSTEKSEEKRFQVQNGKLVRIAIKGMLYNAMSSPVMEFIGALGMGLVIFYGGLQVIQGNSTPGTFFSFLTAMMMLYEPFKRISQSNMVLQKALAGAERVFEIMDSEEIKEESQGEKVLAPVFQELRFDQVSHWYQGGTEYALRDINLTIHSGERLAIVGPSGAGKTTLVNLIPRFYPYGQGQIRLNETPLEAYTLESLRRNIGMVSQETILFNTSIRDNITYGLGEVDQAELEEICSVAYALDFIRQLPGGFETLIGERGVKLSGGEKQRLTIARALLKNPPLLILDEATSALDTQSERTVQKALENLMQKRTSIVIAHRLSTVLSADRILVMEKGRIIDSGTHAELLGRCALYQKLYRMQFQDYPDSDQEPD
ncbi:MAG: ATP-binding cassette domain-containing protein [Desulfohalobiaceae bacterium]|nr:ATP-binding cassette domain-containing protein [Desulfohalobiaceae bacterium]